MYMCMYMHLLSYCLYLQLSGAVRRVERSWWHASRALTRKQLVELLVACIHCCLYVTRDMTACIVAVRQRHLVAI